MPAADLPLPRILGPGHSYTFSLECCPGQIEMVLCSEAGPAAPRTPGAADATAPPPRRVRGATHPPVPIRMDPAPGQHILRRVLDGLKRI